MDIRKYAEEIESYIIERRRFYHARPELSDQEIETTKAIAADLKEMGIESKLFTKHHGLTAEIHGDNPGKTVVLRADIDALNIKEQTGLPFASTNNYMHACGHDCHIAMQLGAAKILTAMRQELHGTVRLLFQPSEETAEGAHWAMDEGCLDGADAIYGTHIWGEVPAPKIDVSAGFRMAANNRFKLTLRGVTAHGSAPHRGIDTITAACAIVMNLQMMVTRFNNATQPLVLTVGRINGGAMYNSIPDRTELEGTIRHFRSDHSIEEEMRRIIGNTAEAMKVEWDLDFRYLNQPLDNRYEEINEICRNAAEKLFGPDIFANMPTLMSSEDFSWYLQKIPGIFTYIGSANPEKGIIGTNHQSTYDVDESVLKNGSALAAQFAYDYLLTK